MLESLEVIQKRNHDCKFLMTKAQFALAQKPGPTHIDLAFQASSPKTFQARSATTGLFFRSQHGAERRSHRFV